jgi:putative intracellular protease/amidase
MHDKNLGKILVSFDETGRPTGIICHGPIVLLSALPNPDAFIASMIAGDGKASSLTTSWPYAGYRATIFSTGEEQALEGPERPRWQRSVLPGQCSGRSRRTRGTDRQLA